MPNEERDQIGPAVEDVTLRRGMPDLLFFRNPIDYLSKRLC